MVTRVGIEMIDKLDLRIPAGTPWRSPVLEYVRFHPSDTYTLRVRPAAHYTGKVDLRCLGIDALVHLQCKHGDKHHKLEILDAGKKPYSELVQIVEFVTDADPLKLGIMRIDLTADVEDVSVPWFRNCVRFRFKQADVEHGQLKYGLIGNGQVETILAGRRPNLFRIYDKTSECEYQFRRMQRKASKDADPLEFEKEFGFKETDIRTRIERQCGGNRIPPELASFGNLQNAPMYNPFTSLEIVTSGNVAIPSPEDCEGLEYYTGLGLYEESQRVGMQSFRKNLNKQTRGNAARTMERYRRFFPHGAENPITLEQIYETYKQSTIAQLAA
jgi:hypothetical protein